MSKKWVVEFRPSAFKELKKLDRPVQKQILDFLDGIAEGNSTLRVLGKLLQGDKAGIWRYRVGD